MSAEDWTELACAALAKYFEATSRVNQVMRDLRTLGLADRDQVSPDIANRTASKCACGRWVTRWSWEDEPERPVACLACVKRARREVSEDQALARGDRVEGRS